MIELTQSQIEKFVRFMPIVEERAEAIALDILGIYFELDYSQKQEFTKAEAASMFPEIEYDMAFVSVLWEERLLGEMYSSYVVFPTDYMTMAQSEWYSLAKDRVLKEKMGHEEQKKLVNRTREALLKKERKKLYDELDKEFGEEK